MAKRPRPLTGPACPLCGNATEERRLRGAPSYLCPRHEWPQTYIPDFSGPVPAMVKAGPPPPAGAVVTPFVVVSDTREQKPYDFRGDLRRGIPTSDNEFSLWVFKGGYLADAAEGGHPLAVRTKAGTLQSGDYSIEGYEDRIVVERKSLDDLYGTIGHGRDRFERELERLAEYEFAKVVIEASWHEAITEPPLHSQLPPKIVWRSVIRWQMRYGVHFDACGDRRLAERMTLRTLESYWREKNRTDSTKPKDTEVHE